MDLSGTWHSVYEYTTGTDSTIKTSEHRIRFKKEADVWIGSSLQNKERSRITLTLKQNEKELAGKWWECTSPNGYYKGKEVKGLILLLVNLEETELSGMWLGAGTGKYQVESGSWILKRESS